MLKETYMPENPHYIVEYGLRFVIFSSNRNLLLLGRNLNEGEYSQFSNLDECNQHFEWRYNPQGFWQTSSEPMIHSFDLNYCVITFLFYVISESSIGTKLHGNKVELSIFENIVSLAYIPIFNGPEGSHLTIEEMLFHIGVNFLQFDCFNRDG